MKRTEYVVIERKRLIRLVIGYVVYGYLAGSTVTYLVWVWP